MPKNDGLCPKIVSFKNNGSNKNVEPQICRSIIFLDKDNFMEKIWSKIIVGSQKRLGHKDLLQIMVGQTNLGPTNVGSKQMLGPKQSWV